SGVVSWRRFLGRLVVLVVRAASQPVGLRTGDEQVPVINPVANPAHVTQDRLGVVAQARQVAANQVRGLALDIAALIPVALGPAHPALHFLAGVVSVILIVQVKVTVRRAALIVEMAALVAGIRVLRVALMIK